MSLPTSFRRLLALTGLAAVAVGQAHAQGGNASITGRVASDDGRPLEGANVFITELNVSVGTNAQGRFSILIPSARVQGQTVNLRARSIGFSPQAKPITLRAGEQSVDFTLAVDVQRLNAVVTTGVTAGTEKAKVPFAVDRVTADELPVPAVNPLTQLQGKVAGANIVSASGRPGAQPAVLLRGPKSMNAAGRGQDPLYIVDGVILNGGLPDLNPLDIESVEVVKGAAAASLYGARAGNGVIQITTKSGKSGQDGLRWTVNSEYGTSDIERDLDIARAHALLMDPTGTRFCRNISGTSNPTGLANYNCPTTFDYAGQSTLINNVPGDSVPSANVPSFPVDPGATISGGVLRQRFQSNPWPGQTHNAVDQFVNPKPFYQNNLDMSGKFGGTQVYASLGQTRSGGAIYGLEGFNRNSVRLNVDQLVGTDWHVAARTFYSRSEQDGVNFEGGGGPFFRLTRVPAFVNLMQRDTLGRLFLRPNLQGGGTQNENPLYPLTNVERMDQRDRFIGNVTVRYQPATWMDLEGNFAYDNLSRRQMQYRAKGYRTTTSNPVINGGFTYRGDSTGENYNASFDLTMRRDLFTDLRNRVSFRYLYEQQDGDDRQQSGTGLAVSEITETPNATTGYALFSQIGSIRGIGMFANLNSEYKERYIVDALVRRDGSSLFGENNRWQNFGRASFAWRVSQEPWWMLPDAVNELKLRASVGTAGGRPGFFSQYETYAIGAGGVLTPANLGNRDLKPEVTTEREFGVDVGLFNRASVEANYSVADTRDQILPVPIPQASGFSRQWQNAGTLRNKTVELALNVPIFMGRDFQWSGRVSYDRNRTRITQLNTSPFTFGTGLQATDAIFLAKEGEDFGSFYGRKFVKSCADLPTRNGVNYAQMCGPGQAFQANDEGYIVWVGQGNTPGEGVTKNLWQTQLPAASSPWNTNVNWGMPMILRDTTGIAQQVKLGNALPRYRYAVTQNIQYKRLTAYGLLDASMGQRVWNQGRHWAHLDFNTAHGDQIGKSVETAKPLGYYYRSAPPDAASGLGGFYDILSPNSYFTEDASYAKVREVMLAYRVGAIAGVGDFSVRLVGRNLYTFTDYRGFDPEVGISGGQSGSSAINAIDAFTFPNLRSFTFGITTSF